MLYAIYITSSIFAIFVAGFICLSPVIYEIGDRISAPVLDHFRDIKVRKANNLHYSLIPGKSFQYVKNDIWREPPFGKKIKISKKELIRGFRGKRDSYRIPPGKYKDEYGKWISKLTQEQYGKLAYDRLALKCLIDWKIEKYSSDTRTFLEEFSQEVDNCVLAYAKEKKIKKNFKSPIDGKFYYHQRQAFSAYLSRAFAWSTEVSGTMEMWTNFALRENFFEKSLHKLTY